MPACYLDRLIEYIGQGFAEVSNPYSGKKSSVDLRPENVHTIVLWSKNFRNFLKKSRCFKKYHLYFLFTIKDMPDFEPGMPSLPERLDQVRELASRFGPERIAWRYDPIVFTDNGPVSTVETFEKIGKHIAEAGIKRTIFSFLDLYGKVKTRNERFALGIVDPPVDRKVEYAIRIAAAAKDLGSHSKAVRKI